MTFVHHLRPRYAEVDMQGVVFNAHWLSYFDEAATRFFEWLGLHPKETFSGDAYDNMLVKAVIEWRGPAGFDDPVAIAVVVARIGTASFDVRYEASVEGRAVCDAMLTYVSIVPRTQTSCPIPEGVRERLASALVP